jgi:hypothetical protein
MTAPDTAVNFAPILQPIFQAIGIAIGIILTGLFGWLLKILQDRTGIQFTVQQQATMLQGVLAAKGTVETRMDQKIMSVSEVHINNPEIRDLAKEVIANAPTAAAALGVTPDSVARSIVGMVDTSSRTPAQA